MQKESHQIMQNLGYTEEMILTIEKETKTKTGNFGVKLSNILKKLGTPDGAIKQIKIIEAYAKRKKYSKQKRRKNKELIETLIKKCKRTLEAFAKKGVQARIVFSRRQWVIEAPEYHPAIQHLHDVCKFYFDEWAEKGINATFHFSGMNTWQVITKREEDSPDL